MVLVVVASHLICRPAVPLTCGPPPAGGVVIGHGLSFEVAVFEGWVSPGPLADGGEPGVVAADPSADRVVGEDPAGVGLLADGMGDLLLERPVVPLHGDVAAPVQVGEDCGERDGLGEVATPC